MLGQSFKVKIDKQSLKFILEQKVGTVSQQRWLSKLLRYDFVIEYKKGKDNKVDDALSRKFETSPNLEEASISLISFPTFTWVEELKASYLLNQDTNELLLTLQKGQTILKGYSLQ